LATEYFVRPYQSGGYANNTGTTYTDAWNGIVSLEDENHWDSILPGDTVYICGVHDNAIRTGALWITTPKSGTPGSPITFSGKCPKVSNPVGPGDYDDGLIVATREKIAAHSGGWTEVSDGVYRRDTIPPVYLHVTEDITTRLIRIEVNGSGNPLVPLSQWPAGSFAATATRTIYYKPSSGLPDDHDVYIQSPGIVNISGQSYIHFKELELVGAAGHLFNISNGDGIHIVNCNMRWATVSVINDSDDGVFQGNTVHDVPDGLLLYTGVGVDANDANNDNWSIADNHIYNINQDRYYGGTDRHGIGVQGGNNIVIERNVIHDGGGPAIAFYNFSNTLDPNDPNSRIGQLQTNNTVRYNVVYNIEDLSDECLQNGNCRVAWGFSLGSDNPPIVPNRATGNKVHHNIFTNIKDIGMRVKPTKPDSGYTWEFLNNVINEVAEGFRSEGGSIDYGIEQGFRFQNNVVMNSQGRNIVVPGNVSSSSGILIDNNLYYPDNLDANNENRFQWGGIVTNFQGWVTTNRDENSPTPADPMFADGGNPNPALKDFHLLAGSPAINAGANVGLSADKDGNPIGANPDIGAYELQSADLSLTLTDTPDPALQGDTVTYTITVTNNGPSVVTGVTVAGTLPSCDLGTIANGATANCTRTATASAVGTLTQTASVSAIEYDPVTANNTASATTTVDAPVSGGLRGNYYNNPDFTSFVLSRIDPTVNFSWSGSPATGVDGNTFSVRWSGKVKPQYSQTYTFYVRSNDGARLWVNGQLLIDNWGPHGTVENSATIALAAGQLVDINLEHWDNTGTAVAKLSWSSPSRSKQVIPSGRLYH
jgi:uncharacterized repeat protein (TIGR01451 family)